MYNQQYQQQQYQQPQPPMNQGYQQQAPAPQQYQQQAPAPQQYQQQAAPQGQAPKASNGAGVVAMGRLVWVAGSLFTGKPKVNDQDQPVIDPRTGVQVVEYSFGLAIPKGTKEHDEVMQAVNREAFALYPNGQIPADFAYKFKDGDGRDHNGKPFADREGYAGHIVIACTTQIPLNCFLLQGGMNIKTNDGIKNGDYVRVQLNIIGHPPKGRGKAGIYMNPSAIQLLQAGKEIINAPSGDQIFGTQAPQYVGPMVVDPGPGAMPGGYAPAPQQGYQQPPMNQGYQQAPAPQQQAPAPQQGYQQAPAPSHYDVLPPQHQPQGAPQQGYQQAPAPQQGYGQMPGQPQYR